MVIEIKALEGGASTNISGVGYDQPTQTLAVRFSNGRVYHYSEVTPKVYEDFNGAESKGKFFFSQIRGKFDFKEIG